MYQVSQNNTMCNIPELNNFSLFHLTLLSYRKKTSLSEDYAVCSPFELSISKKCYEHYTTGIHPYVELLAEMQTCEVEAKTWSVIRGRTITYGNRFWKNALLFMSYC